MTQLRKMMLEELQRRNYSKTTVQTYLKSVQRFAEHFHTPPDRLGLEHIGSYQAYLFQEKKLAATTVSLCTAALRFFLMNRISASKTSNRIRIKQTTGERCFSIAGGMIPPIKPPPFAPSTVQVLKSNRSPLFQRQK